MTMVRTHIALVRASTCLMQNHPAFMSLLVCLGGSLDLPLCPLPSFPLLLWAPCWCPLLSAARGQCLVSGTVPVTLKARLLSPGAQKCAEKPFSSALPHFVTQVPKQHDLLKWDFSVSLSLLLSTWASGMSPWSQGRELKTETRHFFLPTPLPHPKATLPVHPRLPQNCLPAVASLSLINS